MTASYVMTCVKIFIIESNRPQLVLQAEKAIVGGLENQVFKKSFKKPGLLGQTDSLFNIHSWNKSRPTVLTVCLIPLKMQNLGEEETLGQLGSHAQLLVRGGRGTLSKVTQKMDT